MGAGSDTDIRKSNEKESRISRVKNITKMIENIEKQIKEYKIKFEKDIQPFKEERSRLENELMSLVR
jgi:hypothetical protein